MTSKELVRRAIKFEKPERLPFTGSMSETDFSGDTVALFPDLKYKWWLGGGGTDEWGCVWGVEPGNKDMGQVENIVLNKIEDFALLSLPNAKDPARYAGWENILEQAEKEHKYVVCCNGPYLLERAHFLHGFENMLIDIMLNPETAKAFLRYIAGYHLDTLRYIRDHFPGRIHGYRGTDDWGTQNAPLISPETFVRVFQPVYSEIFKSIHIAGMDTWMHSCGQNFSIIPHLIEAGLDVINLMQPALFPVLKLGELKGKICFEICADIQTTLLKNDKIAVSREIQEILDACCSEIGGLIEAKLDRMCYEGSGLSREIIEFCHEEYRKQDPFEN